MIAELGPVIGAILGLAGIIYATRAGVKKSRADRAAQREDAEAEAKKLKPPTFPEMWAIVQQTQAAQKETEEKYDRLADEFDEFKRISASKDRAIGNVLLDLSEQWPGSRPPLLNSQDVEALRDTIPADWYRTRDDHPTEDP